MAYPRRRTYRRVVRRKPRYIRRAPIRRRRTRRTYGRRTLSRGTPRPARIPRNRRYTKRANLSSYINIYKSEDFHHILDDNATITVTPTTWFPLVSQTTNRTRNQFDAARKKRLMKIQHYLTNIKTELWTAAPNTVTPNTLDPSPTRNIYIFSDQSGGLGNLSLLTLPEIRQSMRTVKFDRNGYRSYLPLQTYKPSCQVATQDTLLGIAIDPPVQDINSNLIVYGARANKTGPETGTTTEYYNRQILLWPDMTGTAITLNHQVVISYRVVTKTTWRLTGISDRPPVIPQGQYMG